MTEALVKARKFERIETGGIYVVHRIARSYVEPELYVIFSPQANLEVVYCENKKEFDELFREVF